MGKERRRSPLGRAFGAEGGVLQHLLLFIGSKRSGRGQRQLFAQLVMFLHDLLFLSQGHSHPQFG